MTSLFDIGSIGGLTLRNRVVMAPMTTRLADDVGQVTDDLVAYYTARAAGGTGMIIVEMASPERCGRHRFRELGICEDMFIPGLARLARAIRAEGAVPAIQLGHGGGHTSLRISGAQPVAPSAIKHPLFEVSSEEVMPQAMTGERIEQSIAAFVDAGRRAADAGFEVVEIHAAHGYLISQFLAPGENLRTDDYGGSLRNRARFGLEIVERIRGAIPSLPLVFRFNSDDFFPGGITSDDALQIGIWAEAAGASALHVTGGHYRSLPSAERMIPPMRYDDACFAPVGMRLRTAVRVPVILVGRLGHPEAAQAALDQGACDFVALGRPLLADPQWPLRVQRQLAPRPCLSCNTCVNGMRAGSQLRCIVNPAAGRELKWNAAQIAAERIAVVGAGPAGLTCARELASTNDVTLFERSEKAGGAFRLVGLAPLFQDVDASVVSFERYVDGMVRACVERGVKFRLGEQASADALIGFDRVVFATGASYRFGLEHVVPAMLRRGWGRRRPFVGLLRRNSIRQLLYYALRRGGAPALRDLRADSTKVHVIGDAAQPGKSMEAIESAFALVYGPPKARALQVAADGQVR